MDSFPFTPPICLLRPTSNMFIREGKHVDGGGRIHLPELSNWDYVRFYTLWVKYKIVWKRFWFLISSCLCVCVFCFFFLAPQQPKSSVVSLLAEMIVKFEEHPPLSSKSNVDNKDPHDLLAFVSNIQINNGA